MKRLEQIKEKITYIERCIVTLESLGDDTNALKIPVETKIQDELNEIIDIINNINKDFKADGGAGSGNWGHVGVKGQWGGSAPGGGLGFRLNNSYAFCKDKFTSQAKLRDAIKANMKSSDPRVAAVATRWSKIVNMSTKHGQDLIDKGKFDKNASKNILADVKGEGKQTKVGQISGTKNAMEHTLNGKTNRGMAPTKKTNAIEQTQKPQNPAPKPTPKPAQNPTQKPTQNPTQNPNGQPSQNQKPQGNSNPNGNPGGNPNGGSKETSNPQPSNNNGGIAPTTRSTSSQYAKLVGTTDQAQKASICKNAINNTSLNGHENHSSSENNKLQKVIKAMDVNDKATVVSKDEMEKAIAAGAQPIYRSKSLDELKEFYDSDTNRVGGGMRGPAHYFASGNNFNYSNGWDSHIMRAAVKPDAKAIDYSKAATEARKYGFRSPAEYALANGYDVMIDKSNSFTLPLNRGCLLVQDYKDGGIQKCGTRSRTWEDLANYRTAQGKHIIK